MDLKKILAAATALACLTAPALAVDAGATGGLSISPHAEGVCAPNTPIVQEDAPVAVEPEEEPAEEPEEAEPEQDGDLAIEEMVKINRQGGELWYDIDPEDCPGHEWSEIEPDYEEVGDTLYIRHFRYCLNCGHTEYIGGVEMEPLADEPEDTDAEEYHNDPATDEEIQAALETFDPTIDDPQYQREYERYQRDHGNQEEAAAPVGEMEGSK